MTAQISAWRTVAITAMTTTALLSGALFVQHARRAWPFDAALAAAVHAPQSTAGRAVPGTHDRIAVNVGADTM
jgi:hypothetical protein